MALVDFTRLERTMEELIRFEGGTILHHELIDEAYQKFPGAVRDERPYVDLMGELLEKLAWRLKPPTTRGMRSSACAPASPISS